MYLIKQTIGNYIERNSRLYKNNKAIISVEDDIAITYNEMENKIDIIAKRLMAMGVKKGDHIAVCADNSPEWIILFIATVKIGAVLVSLNNKSTKNEISYFLSQSDSVMFIASDEKNINEVEIEEFRCLRYVLNIDKLFNSRSFNSSSLQISEEKFQKRIDCVGYDDIAMILYTSGTTGKPKAVMHTHKSLLNGAYASAEIIKCDKNDKFLNSLQLCHVMGAILTSLLILMKGGCLVLMAKFKTLSVLNAIQKYKCTIFTGVPTMYKGLLAKMTNENLTSLRLSIIGGACCSHDLIEKIARRLNVEAIANSYGQTEALIISQTLFYNAKDPKAVTVGRAAYGIDIKVCDRQTGEELPCGSEGELYIKSPYIMSGYYNDKKATQSTIVDGWLRTGDIVCVDDQQYIELKYRAKETIIKGGENISPVELEQVLDKHEAIENTAIIGVPDEKMGEEIFAFIKVKENFNITKDEVMNYMENKVSKFKLPKYIKLTDNIPLTSSGKIMKNILKERAIQVFKA